MNRVSFRVDRPRIIQPGNRVERNFSTSSICVHFGEELKCIFSYSENGLVYSPVDKVECTVERGYILGNTTLTLPEVVAIVEDLRKTEFKEYHFVHKNCTHFSNELSKRLCNKGIPGIYQFAGTTVVPAGITVRVSAAPVRLFLVPR